MWLSLGTSLTAAVTRNKPGYGCDCDRQQAEIWLTVNEIKSACDWDQTQTWLWLEISPNLSVKKAKSGCKCKQTLNQAVIDWEQAQICL